MVAYGKAPESSERWPTVGIFRGGFYRDYESCSVFGGRIFFAGSAINTTIFASHLTMCRVRFNAVHSQKNSHKEEIGV